MSVDLAPVRWRYAEGVELHGTFRDRREKEVWSEDAPAKGARGTGRISLEKHCADQLAHRRPRR